MAELGMVDNKEESAKDGGFEGISVIVAEADVGDCISICDVLEEIGITSECICNTDGVLEAVKKARREFDDYYGIILGTGLPGMPLPELIDGIKNEMDEVFIILVADEVEKIRKLPEYADVDYFISRPVDREELKNIFDNSSCVLENMGISDDLKALMELDFTGKRVLLVEDNEMNREVARELLEITGIDVVEAVNGKDAIEIFASFPQDYFDIILMDIQMPLLNGYETAEKIRGICKRDLPIIAMTANAFPEDVKASMESGMEGHLAKPLDMKKMAILLDKCLNK